MRDFCFFLLCLTLCLSDVYGQSIDTYNNHTLISDQEIKARLLTIHSDIVKPRFDPAVRSYINTYTVKRRDRTEAMLGRTAIYYPLFEKLLAEYGLPTDLKYLSVVESALNAQAVSRSGAVGLWQFMKPTGRECGLSINSTVDERKDPEKATKAAIQYLAKQYKRYGNWELALAAYNGGAGRVNRAIKRGRSKNFWKIRRHLPRETRNYVPAFIAATYINKYYQDHDLNPVYPDREFQFTERVKVYQTLTFAELEEMTGTPRYVIEFLNPSYKKHYIPSSVMGSNLVLPQDKMAVFKNNYRAPDSGNRNYIAGGSILIPEHKVTNTINSANRLYYKVEQGDEMPVLAQAFHCTEHDIMKWNKLTSQKLRQGQSLVIYYSKNNNQQTKALKPLPLIVIKPELSEVSEEAINWKPLALPEVTTKKSSKRRKSSKSKKKKEKFVYHKVERGESLFTIAAQYKGIAVKDIIEINNMTEHDTLKPGKKIKVKRK